MLMLTYSSIFEFDQRLQIEGRRSVGCDGIAAVSLRGHGLGAMVHVPLKVKRPSSIITLK
jgi:hypothetical protein